LFGLAGPVLGDDERAFFRDSDPVGFVLFGRNCVDRKQLRALTDDLRSLSGRDDLPILIDQEGGRVARLGPPEWPPFPAAERFGRLYDVAPITAIEAARVNAQAMAAMLAEVGITVDLAPVLDLLYPQTHAVIGDRALGAEPMKVAALGRAMLDGLEAGGVIGVVKHMPGLGRAAADSHEELPVVTVSEQEMEADLAPFRALASAPAGMVAHLLLSAWDAQRPASTSPALIAEVIRGRIGFEGLLLSDDICMGALPGSIPDRAEAVIEAGCDLALHCSGDLAEAQAIAKRLSPISGAAKARLQAAMARTGKPSDVSFDDLADKRDALFAAAPF
jgi:beta-N-acetylhexosaminidase